MPKPAKVPEKLYAIMLKCWAAAPEERPTFETLAWQLEDFFEDDEQFIDTEEVNKFHDYKYIENNFEVILPVTYRTQAFLTTITTS